MDEERLHAGIMKQALEKLPPDPSPVFRGATYSAKEFADEIGTGKVFSFPSFASASKERGTAEAFAKTNGKDHAVIFLMRNSGGRDVSKISTVGAEQEVTLMAGSKYVVQSVTQIAALSPADRRTWHEVVLSP
jgi:hypothetical protein